MDTVMYGLRLVFPLVFAAGGVAMLLGGITGASKMFEDSPNPKMQNLLARFGKTKLRVVYTAAGVLSLLLAAALFRGWLAGF